MIILRNIFFYTLASSIALSAFGQRDFRTLTERSPGEQAALLERYGPAATAAVRIMIAIEQSKGDRQAEVDRASADRAIAELTSIRHDDLGTQAKAQLGRAWWKAAELTRRLEGPSEEMLAQLEVAISLAPDEEGLIREAQYQRARASIVAARLQQAAQIREARKRGEDPYDGFEERVAGAGKTQPQH